MWKIATILITASLLAFSASVAADEDKSFTATDAEKKIMKACIENKDNNQAQCVCVLSGLKTELPQKNYDFLMNIIVFAMNGDMGSIWRFA